MSQSANYVMVLVTGGLGNQMFQYAAARRLAHVNRAQLLIYPGKQRRGTHKIYGLNRFHTTGRIATDSEAGGLRRISKTRRRLSKLLPALRVPHDPEVFDEGGSLLYNPAVMSLRANVKLRGYWQCERYFAGIAGIVRKEFTLCELLDVRSRDTLARIESGPSAFIHVRRGDYVTNPVHGTCPAAYYHEAASLLRQRFGPHLRFFVFSNGPGWALGWARDRIAR